MIKRIPSEFVGRVNELSVFSLNEGLISEADVFSNFIVTCSQSIGLNTVAFKGFFDVFDEFIPIIFRMLICP